MRSTSEPIGSGDGAAGGAGGIEVEAAGVEVAGVEAAGCKEGAARFFLGALCNNTDAQLPAWLSFDFGSTSGLAEFSWLRVRVSSL